jgi:hypothetical protein
MHRTKAAHGWRAGGEWCNGNNNVNCMLHACHPCTATLFCAFTIKGTVKQELDIKIDNIYYCRILFWWRMLGGACKHIIIIIILWPYMWTHSRYREVTQCSWPARAHSINTNLLARFSYICGPDGLTSRKIQSLPDFRGWVWHITLSIEDCILLLELLMYWCWNQVV